MTEPVDEAPDPVIDAPAIDEPAVVEPAEVEDAPDGAATTPVVPRRRATLQVSLAIAAVVLILDQLTKRWALNALADGRSRHVIWTLDWNLTFNSGMAFSRAQGVGPYIGAVAFIVIVIMLLSVRRTGSRLSTVAVGLVVGGAIGNLADRVFRGDGWLRGSVIDFIDFRWWPIFNVADMGVTVGGALLLLTALFESRRAPR
ncbi:MAG: lspA [Ilumatobacteraceae bacterium]|nr:lspA [Ilumatobacteraceae bacterium]